MMQLTMQTEYPQLHPVPRIAGTSLLSRKSAPWAFAKGEPFRTIAALELTAVLVAVKLFCVEGDWKGRRAVLKLTAFRQRLQHLCSEEVSELQVSPVGHPAGVGNPAEGAGLELDLGWCTQGSNDPCGQPHQFYPRRFYGVEEN